MNDICVYSIQTYEKQILGDYYCQIMTHEICDVTTLFKLNYLSPLNMHIGYKY